MQNHTNYETIYGKVYQRTSGRTVLKYICEEGDDIAIWQQRMDDLGAERGTVDDMLSIGEDEPDDIHEIIEMDVPDDLDVMRMDGGGFAPIDDFPLDGDLDILPID